MLQFAMDHSKPVSRRGAKSQGWNNENGINAWNGEIRKSSHDAGPDHYFRSLVFLAFSASLRLCVKLYHDSVSRGK